MATVSNMHLLLALVYVSLFLEPTIGHAISNFEELEEWRRAVGGPVPNPAPVTPDSCKRDIAILMDTSNSIGQSDYEDDVIPFLEGLVQSPKLNVGPDGTWLSLVTFSDMKHTELKFGFGANTTQDYLYFFKNDMSWSSVHGPRTRTGTGAKIIDLQVLPEESPFNARSNVHDVLIIMTDGRPRGTKRDDELNLAYHYTSSLKNKSILIVGVAVGNPNIVKQFNHTILKMATSNSTMFNSEFDDLDKIIDQLVDASCTPFKPGDCDCPTIQSQDVYIQSSQSTVDVSWVEPTLKCRKDRVPKFVTKTVTPNITSPYAFGVGDHDIEYTYTFRGGFDLKCHVKIAVKSCTCPSLPPITAHVTSDTGSAPVHWVAPVPSCGAILKSIQPNTTPGSSFALGSHTVNYIYNTVAGFDLTCGIDIHVKKCSCQSTTIVDNFYMKPDSPNGKRKVSWIEPKPDCTGQSIQKITISPDVKPGASFGVGSHSVHYSYLMSSGMYLQCSVHFRVKVVPCGGTDYSPATHMCCCAKVQRKETGRKCCGRKTYDSTVSKCCSLNYNIVGLSENCPGEDISV